MFLSKKPLIQTEQESSLGMLPFLIGITMLTCVLCLVLFNALQVQNQTLQVKAETQYLLEREAQDLEQIISSANASLRAIEVFVRQTPKLDQAAFEQFSALLAIENPAIRSLQYAPDGILTFMTNLSLNRGALGLNLYEAPKTAPFLEEAALTGKTVMEGPRELSQGGNALIFRYPVFRQRDARSNRDLMGFAAVLIDFEYIKQNIIEPLEQKNLVVRVTQKSPMQANWLSIHGTTESVLIDPVSSTVFFPYGEWKIEIAPKNSWSAPIAIQPYLVLLAVAGMIVVIGMSLHEYRARVALLRAYQSSESANDHKEKLITNVSHEIRTPLSSVNSIAIMLNTSAYPDEIRELGRAVKQSSEVINTIVNDLLDLSKIRQGHFRLNNVSFRLEDLVENTANILQYQWLQKPGVEPVVLEPKFSQNSYFGDKGRIEQVLQNLISNAYKFTMFGRVTVRIDIMAKNRECSQLVVAVSDTGVGIPENDIERVFDAFYQVDSSLRKKYNGAGLGLAICRQIVEAMGGTIQVRSQAGHGTQFEFCLPLMHDKAKTSHVKYTHGQGNRMLLQIGDAPFETQLLKSLEPDWQARFLSRDNITDKSLPVHDTARLLIDLPGPQSTAKVDWLKQFLNNQHHAEQAIVLLGCELPAVAAEHNIRLMMKPLTRNRLNRIFARDTNETTQATDNADALPLRLLLAEDNALNAKVFKKLLENRGAAVSCVNNGADAVALLTNGNMYFDAVLMDLQMPVMDGLEAIRLIRKNEALQELLVYAVSGHVSNSMKNECLHMGFTDFVTKPFDPDLLVENIQARLEHLRGLV